MCLVGALRISRAHFSSDPSFDAALSSDSLYLILHCPAVSLLQASLWNVRRSRVVLPVPLHTSVHQMFKSS